MRRIKLEEYNEKSFQEAGIEMAILAIGSTESHGGHLPFGCDTFVSHDIACEVAARVDKSVVVPPLWYGMSRHYRHKPMCVSLSSQTLMRVLIEVMESLIFWNIPKILIINGHDGNIAPIEIAARDIKVSHPELKLAVLDAWWVTAGNLLPEDTFEVWNGLGHGGEGETSIGLAVFPELCDMTQAKGHIPELDDSVKLVWNFDELTDFGSSGASWKGTAEKGREMKRVLVDHLVQWIQKMDAKDWKIAKK